MPDEKREEDDWITTSAAAKLMGISRATIARYTRQGLLPALRLPSGRLRVRRSEVEKLLREGQLAE